VGRWGVRVGKVNAVRFEQELCFVRGRGERDHVPEWKRLQRGKGLKRKITVQSDDVAHQSGGGGNSAAGQAQI